MAEASEFRDQRMPVIYLSHGAPPLADDPLWTRQLADWSATMPEPSSVLMVSAHWEDDPLTLSATKTVPLFYDFYGFPQHYYEVQYPAPGAPALADEVERLLGGANQGVHRRGLLLSKAAGYRCCVRLATICCRSSGGWSSLTPTR